MTFSWLCAPAIGATFLLSLTPVAAEIMGDDGKRTADQRIDDTYREINEFDKRIDYDAKGAEVRRDPVLRQIVCRVGFAPFSLPALQKAMGLAEQDTKDAVDKLKLMALVRTEASAGVLLVVPFSDEAAAMMRRWADEWCVGDDSCGVKW